MLRIDNTKRSTFVACPRKYQLNYLNHVFSVKGSTALRYGSVWHKALEGFYTAIAEHGWTSLEKAITLAGEKATEAWNLESDKFTFYDDYRTLQNLMLSFVRYMTHYHGDEGFMEIVKPEQVFKILITPTKLEEHAFPGVKPFLFTGQIDLQVKLSGRKWLMEHKSTGSQISRLSNQLHRTPQIMGYNYAAKVLSKEGEIPDGSLVSIHHLSAYKSRKTGEYGKPKIDFSRVPQIFSNKDLALWRFSFMSDIYDMQVCTERETFPERHYSCYTYGACTYINICEQSRPTGMEILNGFFIDNDPWDVLKGREDRLATIESEDDTDMWNELQEELLPHVRR